VCIALCTIVAHNTAQNRPDNFPSYPPGSHHCSIDVYLNKGEGCLNEETCQSTLVATVAAATWMEWNI